MVAIWSLFGRYRLLFGCYLVAIGRYLVAIWSLLLTNIVSMIYHLTKGQAQALNSPCDSVLCAYLMRGTAKVAPTVSSSTSTQGDAVEHITPEVFGNRRLLKTSPVLSKASSATVSSDDVVSELPARLPQDQEVESPE